MLGQLSVNMETNNVSSSLALNLPSLKIDTTKTDEEFTLEGLDTLIDLKE